MTDHYYSQEPVSRHDEQNIKAWIGKREYDFYTDAGVFSKGRVDFGSCLLVETFLKHFPQLDEVNILELGSGYGPIALSLSDHYPKAQVLGVEINQRAYELAKVNQQKLGLGNCHFELGDACQVELELSYDFVLTNPPIRAGKRVIQSFVKQAHHYLKPEGQLWLVIQKKQGAPSMQDFMEEIFDQVERVDRDKGYWILMGQK